MSWLFAYFGNDAQNVRSSFQENKSFAAKSILGQKSFVAVAKESKNVFYDFDNPRNKWATCGIGILKKSNTFSYASKHDWRELVNNPDSFSSIDGHFITLLWDDDYVEVHTDTLGLRDIYLAQTKTGILLSTRPDWIAPFKKLGLDFSEFGTRWKTFNQISSGSVIKGCSRICRGQRVEIQRSNHSFIIKPRQFPRLRYSSKLTESEIKDEFERITKFPFESGSPISLSLSGGMDSRLLLSILLNQPEQKWNTHTFGNPRHPDALVAQLLSNRHNFSNELLELPFPSFDEAINELRDYACKSIVNNAASAILQLRNYRLLKNSNSIIIDGGFGEIWRREFLFGLQVKGKEDIQNRNEDGILNHIRLFRSDCFSQDVNLLMDAGCREQVSNLISDIPPIEDMNFDHWLDLFAIYTRLPNYYGHEQAVLDEIVTAYMPFAQMSLLKKLFLLNPSLKRNGRLFKRIIQLNKKELTKTKLVKGVVFTPCGLTSLQSRIYSQIRKRIKTGLYPDRAREKFLNLFKDYNMDLINSQRIKECEYYDYSKIRDIVIGYYKGNKEYSDQLDWWLTFELFRQAIERK